MSDVFKNEGVKDVGINLFSQMMGKRHVGSSRIRGHWLIKYWNRAEILKMSKKYKAVIFQKSYWTEYAKAFKGIKIFDICDADFMWWHYKTREMLEECHAVTTSTPALAEAFKKFTPKNKPVICIPDRIDLEVHKEKKEHKGDARWAVWFGYSNNFNLLEGVEKHLHKLGLNLIIISDKNFSEGSNYPIRVMNIRWNPDTINADILKGDIVLNPFSNKGHWKYKSNNKSLTAWALGMPVATSPDDLKRFISETERKKEAEIKLKEVQEQWDIRLSISQYEDLIKQIEKDANFSLPE